MKFLIVAALSVLVPASIFYTYQRLKARMILALEKQMEERQQRERELRASKEKFRVLVEKAAVGIRIIRDNVIKYVNPMGAKIFGYSPTEILNKNPLELVFEEDRPKVNLQLEKRLKGSGNTRSYEFKGITRRGNILYLESYSSLILYQGQPALLESIIDITCRKKAVLELIKTRYMESVGVLAGGIAHDFNNLLTVIIGNTGMLKLNFDSSNPRIFSLLENVEKATAQAADLAQKFITFSSGGWITRKKITLAKILKETANLSPEIKEIPYEVIIPPDLEPIYVDEHQLRQVVTNLLLNAHEATNNTNKKIAVKAKRIILEKENPFSLKEGKYVKISVIDNGQGIPPELLEKVFDPYFSTKDTVSQRGLGLGLAICYSIVKKHDGHIAITSEVQKGTTADIYLPIYGK